MTVKELRKALEILEKDGYADQRMTVNTLGGFLRGSNANIHAVGPGFDWDSDQVIIFTDPQLGVYQKPSKRPGASKARPMGKRRPR